MWKSIFFVHSFDMFNETQTRISQSIPLLIYVYVDFNFQLED